MESSLYKGQLPFRPKGKSTCMHHKGKQLDLHCKKCQELICIKCLSSIHDSHAVCGLDDIVPQKTQVITNFLDKTEKVDLVQIDQYITSTDQHLKANTSHFDKLSQQVKSQTDKLKEELDLVSGQTLSLYKQMEEDNAKLLQTYKQELKMYKTQLKEKGEECKKALQDGSNIGIYDAGCDLHFLTLPVKPALGTAKFRPNRNPKKYLEKALGDVDNSGQGLSQTSTVHDLLVGSSAGQKLSSTYQRSSKEETSVHRQSKGRKEVSSPVYSLISETKMLGEWWSPCYITSLCPTPDGQSWTSFYSVTLTLLDRSGNALQEVNHSTRIWGISLSPSTNTLWVCDCDNNILELVAGRLEQRFDTRQKPECICITASNHVIVGMDNHISKFTPKGKLLLTTLAIGSGKPIVGSPYRVSECPVTQNVAVVDLNYIHDGVNVKPHVVVMDTNFRVRFEYDGKVPDSCRPSSRSEGKPFSPSNVVYDIAGNLVIGDCNHNRILLMSGLGDFLRILHTDNHSTFAVDKIGVLWAILGIGNVKLLQYFRV